MKYALRSLAKSPGFTAIALLTLALGIGLNTAMFNVVNAIVLRPVRLPELDTLFRLQRIATQTGQTEGHRPAHFAAIAPDSADIAQLACSRQASFTLAEENRPAEMLSGLRASAGYFSILRLPMTLGREFQPAEDVPGRNNVVILGHAFWLSRFGGDPGVIGRTLRLDGQPSEIVGVAPAEAADPRILDVPDIYRPLALTPAELTDRGPDRAFRIIGRYLPGVTAMEADARFGAIAARLAIADPKDYEGRELRRMPLHPELGGTGRQIVLMLVGLSGFVLLIACANLANLLLARAIARTREFAIRGALGASRAQLLRPLLGECLVLATAGGALGLLVCLWTNDWMARQFSASGSSIEFPVDWRLLAFAFATSLVTGVFFGLAPAWLVARVNINETLKTGARGATSDRSQNRFRSVLIAGQFALALMLLTGAVMFVRGLDQLLQREAGWSPAPLLRGVISLPDSRYPGTDRMMQFYQRVVDRVATLPGVAAAAICHEVPLFRFPSGRGFLIEGRPPAPPGNEPFMTMNGVTSDYFKTVGTRLIRGREFQPGDRADSPRVIILNESMARILFPGEDALGRRLAYFDEAEPAWMEVVGIVEDIRFFDLADRPARFQSYVPLAQATWSYVMLVVRADAPAETLVSPIRLAVSELDPDLALKDLMPVPHFIRRSTQDLQTINQLLVGFASLGLFLAALGIYGVVTRLVAQRTSEIGIRMALGAQLSDIARLILGAGLRLVLIGSGLGLLGAIALARFLSSSMPGLSSNGVSAIAAATAVLIAAATLACWLPTRRATQVNPIIALRSE